jgi:hypothetical protein
MENGITLVFKSPQMKIANFFEVRELLLLTSLQKDKKKYNSIINSSEEFLPRRKSIQ